MILREIGIQLTRWICGRVIAMAMVGVCVGTGLALMHVPLALPLGVLAGALAFIEYLGSVASAAPAMLLAFTRSPIFAVWVGLLFLGVHIVEGYVLTPLLARQMIRIPPAYMLGTQVVLGEVFGVSGLTFATPARRDRDDSGPSPLCGGRPWRPGRPPRAGRVHVEEFAEPRAHGAIDGSITVMPASGSARLWSALG